MLQQKPDDAEKLIMEIEKTASENAEQIIQQAKSKAQEILDDARKKAQQIIDDEKKKTQEFIAIAEQKAEASIKMELRRKSLELKKQYIEKVLEAVKQKVSEFRKSAQYRDFLKNAVLEAIEVIDSPEINISFSGFDEIYFNPDFEKEIMEICRKDLKKEVSIRFIKTDLRDAGIIGVSGDGRIVYENTITARMQRMYDEIYAELLKENL